MTADPVPLWLAGWAVTALVMIALWFVQRRTGDAGIVDVAWSAALGALAIAYAVFLDADPVRRTVVASLAAVWSFRLAIHLYVDRIHGKEEDGRYQALRRQWGDRQQAYLFGFYQLQALAAAVLSLPFLLAMLNPHSFPSGWDVAAVAVWLAAFAGEVTADAQLARFRARPENRGKTCRVGLWSWSRHPNYFFEWLYWWTWVLLAAGTVWMWPIALAPLVMLVLLFRVTGIPATEARALESRGDDYRDYQRTTSVFVPLPPRRSA